MSTSGAELNPSRIGRYRIVQHLKTGGMAAVYKAEDPKTGRVVALKVLTPESAAEPRRLERFRREARQGARLRHENIVTLYEFGEADGRPYLALEFVDGIDVEEILRLHGPLTPDDARAIVVQVARALDYAHHMGVVHRDIKPSNILITRRHGRCIAKLVDLGLARGGIEEESRVTADGSTVGTVDYMAPEQARDSAAADVRSDIYALGCTLYHMLAGVPPFAEGSILERLQKHHRAEPADLRLLNPAVSDALWAVCRRMLAKKASQRYQTPAELLADLAHAAPAPASGPAGAGAGAPSPAPKRRSKLDGTRTPPTRTDVPLPPAGSGSLSLSERLSADVPGASAAPSDEGRRIVERQFEHATHSIATGNFEYGLTLLLNCCRAEPGNLTFHQALRQGQLARRATPGLRPWRSLAVQLYLRARLKLARYLKQPPAALRFANELLTCVPDDVAVQLDMARAARDAGFGDLAIWLLETVQSEHPDQASAGRLLAETYEEQGNLGRALELWEEIAAADRDDGEAQRKVRDLAASQATGRFYEARKNQRRSSGNSLLT